MSLSGVDGRSQSLTGVLRLTDGIAYMENGTVSSNVVSTGSLILGGVPITNFGIGPTGPSNGIVGPTGPQGLPGPQGFTGAMGPTGAIGATGLSSTITIGTTTTGYPGTNAIVSNSGTSNNVILNFTIPRGADGPQGPQGNKGDKGNKGNDGADGASVNIGDVVSLVLSAIGFGALQSQISTLSGTVIGIQGELITIQVEIDALQVKTANLTNNGTESKFSNNLYITDGFNNNIRLNTNGTSQYYGDMTVGLVSSNNNLTVNGQIYTKEIICESAISFTNNVGIIGYQTPTLNIGNSLLNSVINIGGGTSVINLNGLVNNFNISSFINQMA
jgi:hypothetical protein